MSGKLPRDLGEGALPEVSDEAHGVGLVGHDDSLARLRLRANSKAKRMIRSTPLRVDTSSWTATSSGVPFLKMAARADVGALRVLAEDDEVDVARPRSPSSGQSRSSRQRTGR